MATSCGLIAILMWGLLALLAVYTQQMPPFQLLALCFAIAFMLMVVSRLIQCRRPVLPWATPFWHWMTHIVCLLGFHACYFLAVRYAPAIQVSLIGYLWPLLLAIIIAAPGLRGYAFVGGLFGLAGAAVLITGGRSLTIEVSYLPGYGLALMCALIWAGYSWFLARTPSTSGHIGWAALMVAVIAGLIHLATENTWWPTHTYQWLAVVLLGLGPVGGAFYLWDVGMKSVNPGLLASCSFATPVISACALYLAGFSPLTHAVVLAVGLIIAGAIIGQQASRLQRWRQHRWQTSG